MAKQIKQFDPKIEKRGLHNWKHLFAKPTTTDMIILILLLLSFGMALVYKRDIQACRDFYDENACEICSNSLGEGEGETTPTMFVPDGMFKEENQSINGSVT